MEIREKQIKKYYRVKRQNQNGVKIDDACLNVGICKATYYSYKTKIELEKKRCKENGTKFIKYGKDDKINTNNTIMLSTKNSSISSVKRSHRNQPRKSDTLFTGSNNKEKLGKMIKDSEIELIATQTEPNVRPKKKPVEKCSKQEIKEELQGYFDKYL